MLCILDWESFEHSTAFAGSKEYVSFMDGMGRVFDLEAAGPLTSIPIPCSGSQW